LLDLNAKLRLRFEKMNPSSRTDGFGQPVCVNSVIAADIKNRLTPEVERPESTNLVPLGSKAIAKASMKEMQFLVET
jgi:hypothetical protein